MRYLLLICSTILIVTTHSFGQQVYMLAPDTKGNQIDLSVANETPNTIIEQVSVELQSHDSWLTFPWTSRQIPMIAANKEANATFMFDVSRNAPMSKRDTLEFRITDKSGSVWMKSVIVQYAGPSTFALDQNFPNPFNPTTRIKYQLPVESNVTLIVYDLLGREVEKLVNERKPAGYFDARWDATNVASGVYFYRIDARPVNGSGSFQQIKKLMVVK